MPGPDKNAFHALTPRILSSTLWGRPSCCIHFTGEETEAQRGKKLRHREVEFFAQDPLTATEEMGTNLAIWLKSPTEESLYTLPLHYQYPMKLSLLLPEESSLCSWSQETSPSTSPPAWLSFVHTVAHLDGVPPSFSQHKDENGRSTSVFKRVTEARHMIQKVKMEKN